MDILENTHMLIRRPPLFKPVSQYSSILLWWFKRSFSLRFFFTGG